LIDYNCHVFDLYYCLMCCPIVRNTDVLHNFLNSELGISDVNGIPFQSVHRLGTRPDGKERSIIARFNWHNVKIKLYFIECVLSSRNCSYISKFSFSRFMLLCSSLRNLSLMLWWCCCTPIPGLLHSQLHHAHMGFVPPTGPADVPITPQRIFSNINDANQRLQRLKLSVHVGYPES
jgi:hypothetical protein